MSELNFLISFFRLIIKRSHLNENGPRKFSKIHLSRMAYKNFDLRSFIVSILTYSSNENWVYNQIYYIDENHYYDFSRKISKIVMFVLQQNANDDSSKFRETA